MILEETKKIINVLDANYDILSGDGKKDTLLIGTWNSILQFYDYNDVGKACGNYIANNRIKPKPSDIKSELDVMQAKRHSVYNQIESKRELSCEAKLTKQNLQDIFVREFASFVNMNLPEKLRDELKEKHNQKTIDDFVAKVWGYVMGSDFQVFHIEMVLGKLRGTKFTFERFMKALVNCREFADRFLENKESNIGKCRKSLNELRNILNDNAA